MIDLTPLDVRKKRGDFGKGLRGYDPQEVDGFLELVAERMEVLVKENLAFRGKIEELAEKVVAQQGREQAIQDALVTAQELRQDVKKQASREAKLLEREAQGRIELMVGESEKLLSEHRAVLQGLERQRERFLKTFRTLLERELDTVEVEFGRAPLEDVTLDLDLGRGSRSIEAIEDEGEDESENQDEDEDEDEDENQGEAEDENQDKNRHGDEQLSEDSSLGSNEEFNEDSTEDGEAQRDKGDAENDDQEAAGDPRPPEGKEGGDSLWLSSIMTDRKDEDAE